MWNEKLPDLGLQEIQIPGEGEVFTKFLEQVLFTGIAFPCPSALKHRQACHEQDEGRKNYQGCIGVEINLLYKPFRNNLQGFKKLIASSG